MRPFHQLETYLYYREIIDLQKILKQEMASIDFRIDVDHLCASEPNNQNDTLYQKICLIEGKQHRYISNVGEKIEEFPEKMDHYYLKILSDQYVTISESIKSKYKNIISQLQKIKNIRHAVLFSLEAKSNVFPHIDQEHLPEKSESGRTNIIISVSSPSDQDCFLDIDDVNIAIDNDLIVAFNAQYVHGARNHSDQPWMFMVLHIPTADFEC